MSTLSSIRPSRSQLEDLAAVCRIDEQKLRRALAALQASPLVIERRQIEDILAAAVDGPAMPALSRVLFSVATPIRQNEDFVQQAFDGVEFSIANGTLAGQFENWSAYRTILEDMVSVPSIRLTAKARDVAYDFERLYLNGRFLTTIRPIFNDDRTAILGAAIVQTLRIEYSSSSGEAETISIAFDANDIEQLSLACNEALRKSRIASEDLESHWKIPVSMMGEDVR